MRLQQQPVTSTASSELSSEPVDSSFRLPRHSHCTPSPSHLSTRPAPSLASTRSRFTSQLSFAPRNAGEESSPFLSFPSSLHFTTTTNLAWRRTPSSAVDSFTKVAQNPTDFPNPLDSLRTATQLPKAPPQVIRTVDLTAINTSLPTLPLLHTRMTQLHDTLEILLPRYPPHLRLPLLRLRLSLLDLVVAHSQLRPPTHLGSYLCELRLPLHHLFRIKVQRTMRRENWLG